MTVGDVENLQKESAQIANEISNLEQDVNDLDNELNYGIVKVPVVESTPSIWMT